MPVQRSFWVATASMTEALRCTASKALETTGATKGAMQDAVLLLSQIT